MLSCRDACGRMDTSYSHCLTFHLQPCSFQNSSSRAEPDLHFPFFRQTMDSVRPTNTSKLTVFTFHSSRRHIQLLVMMIWKLLSVLPLVFCLFWNPSVFSFYGDGGDMSVSETAAPIAVTRFNLMLGFTLMARSCGSVDQTSAKLSHPSGLFSHHYS